MTRSAAARGEFADLERARKGSSALRARVCSMLSCGCWSRFELGLLGELVGVGVMCGGWISVNSEASCLAISPRSD